MPNPSLVANFGLQNYRVISSRVAFSRVLPTSAPMLSMMADVGRVVDHSFLQWKHEQVFADLNVKFRRPSSHIIFATTFFENRQKLKMEQVNQ